MLTSDHSLRAAQPEAAVALERVREVARTAVDPDLIELCRRRVATMLGDDREPARPEHEPTGREAAFLAFTEQFVLSVASVSDADVDALLAHAEPVEVYQFIAALYGLEMSLRVDLAARVLLDRQEVAA